MLDQTLTLPEDPKELRSFTARLLAEVNAVDPHAWLADTLARIPDYKITKIDDLLPWRRNAWKQIDRFSSSDQSRFVRRATPSP